MTEKKLGRKAPRRGRRSAEKADESGLSDIQKRFLQEYIAPTDGGTPFNGVEAAYRSGLCKKKTKYESAVIRASKLLATQAAADYLAELRKPIEEKHGITRERLIQEYKSLAFGTLADFVAFDENKQPYFNIADASREQMAALSTLEITELPPVTLVSGGVEYQREVVKVRGGISMREKKAALDTLLRLMGHDKPQEVEVKGQIEHKHAGEITLNAAEAVDIATRNLEKAMVAIAMQAKNQKLED